MRSEGETVDGVTKSQLETPMLVNQLAGVDSPLSTQASETKMLIIMMMAELAEAEVEVAVAVLITKVVIVLNLRAASSAEKKVTFQENVLILAEGEAVEALQEVEVDASSAARRVTWLVIVPIMSQEAITILRVVVEVEEELQAAVVSVTSARERVTLLETALTTMAMAMLSPTSVRGEMMMVALTAEEVEITTTMLRPQAMLSGVTILRLHRTRVHSGVQQTTITLMAMPIAPGEILTPTIRHLMMHGVPATTTMKAAATAGTEHLLTKLNLFISM